MDILKAIQVTKSIFAYELLGLGKSFVYNVTAKRWMTTDRETGAILADQDFPDELDIETFQLVAQNMHLDLIDSDANVPMHFENLHKLN